MSVGEDKVIFMPAFFGKLVAEPSNAGPGINDDDIVVFCSDLQTGGIAAIPSETILLFNYCGSYHKKCTRYRPDPIFL